MDAGSDPAKKKTNQKKERPTGSRMEKLEIGKE